MVVRGQRLEVMSVGREVKIGRMGTDRLSTDSRNGLTDRVGHRGKEAGALGLSNWPHYKRELNARQSSSDDQPPVAQPLRGLGE